MLFTDFKAAYNSVIRKEFYKTIRNEKSKPECNHHIYKADLVVSICI